MLRFSASKAAVVVYGNWHHAGAGNITEQRCLGICSLASSGVGNTQFVYFVGPELAFGSAEIYGLPVRVEFAIVFAFELLVCEVEDFAGFGGFLQFVRCADFSCVPFR